MRQFTGNNNNHGIDKCRVLKNPLFIIKYLGDYLLSFLRGIAIIG